jgi:hypothetical protein
MNSLERRDCDILSLLDVPSQLARQEDAILLSKRFQCGVEWSEPAEFPGGGTYHSPDGAKRYLTQSKAGISEGTSEPEEFVVVGDRVVVLVHARVRRKGSDAQT